MRSAEIFAGCGGLALGLCRAGFQPQLMAEWDDDAVATVLHNISLGVEHVASWPMVRADVRTIDWRVFTDRLDLISGGPPCQPFAIGGLKAGEADARDMWPEAIRAVREARPRGFVFENVRNLAGPKFRDYLDWILESLRRPGEQRRAGESRQDHIARIRRSSRAHEYEVCWQVVNAADYGAPQIRHRVVIFGVRSDLGVQPTPMSATHSRERLLYDQFETGSYWKRHGLRSVSKPNELSVNSLIAPPEKPWVTLRDATFDLGKPGVRGDHAFRAGARVYAGHTGSEEDLPSKALKAGDHGVPGGENMIRFNNGKVRYLTTREAARLVGLPDEFKFPRSWTESMRQMGNAVPTQLAEAAGRHILKALEKASSEAATAAA